MSDRFLPAAVNGGADTTAMTAQIRGFRTRLKRDHPLGHYQEVRARHLQRRVHDYVGGYPND